MKDLLFLLLAIAFCVSYLPAFSRGGDQWELELDENGTRVYTQIDQKTRYKQVKVVTTIDAPMETVVDVLLRFSGYKDWMHQVNDCHVISQSDSVYYVYLHEDPSWPVQDRYQVSRVKVKRTYQKARIDFESVPDYIPKKVDAIQIRQYEGYWSLHSRSESQCFLEYVLIHQPGGHVPPWLANLLAYEKPHKSILNLRRVAESRVFRM